MTSIYKPLGDLVQLVDERNKDLTVKRNLGLSISKEFIPTVGNTVGTNMANYKFVKKNQFACSLMQVRRDKKMPVALLRHFDQVIISPAYPVFKVIDEEVLLPEYLMMWFSREEFDRHACFLAVGGVRGSLEWDDFMEMELPVPSIEKQRAIVKEYQTITDRIKLNEQLNQKLEETAQAIYRHWFIDFEFPNEDGLPYKSSGGEMVYNEELDHEIPKGWFSGELGDICFFSTERIEVSDLTIENYFSTENMLPDRGGVRHASKLPSASRHTRFRNGDVLISNIRPYLKKIWRAEYSGGCSNDVLVFRASDSSSEEYMFHVLERDAFFDHNMRGTKGTKMPRGDKDWIMSYPIVIPPLHINHLFSEIISPMIKQRQFRRNEQESLIQLSSLILNKMSLK